MKPLDVNSISNLNLNLNLQIENASAKCKIDATNKLASIHDSPAEPIDEVQPTAKMRVTRATAAAHSIQIEEKCGEVQNSSLKKKQTHPPIRKQASKKRKLDKNAISDIIPAESANKKNEQGSMAVAEKDFIVGDIVWAKIKGHSHWPAKLTAQTSRLMVEVLWFNEYRRTKVYRSQLFEFIKNCEKFSGKFDSVIGLRTAVKEAMVCFGNIYSESNAIMNKLS